LIVSRPVKWRFFAIGLAACAGACGGSSSQATQNRVFYDWAAATDSASAKAFEKPYPPLDSPGQPPNQGYLGVAVLNEGVRFAKPRNWILRDAGNQKNQSYVGYISPNAYSFAVYERLDSPSTDWVEVLKHYEEDAQAVGAKIVGTKVPIATGVGQGRAYTIQRLVEAVKSPLVSNSREYVVRGKRRVVLVQIVYEGDDLTLVSPELLHVVETLEVL